ncbi:histone deacetylase family protein [Roseomonas sp. GC11]|uniref:histone deacetylase family protein n=1 Tax=Roseomonas sp. GC11 TaxID=2950546 RepID=UPI00210B512D|nr:histone deacetylase family protein [Roseomonas sp. GC11]MCQ4159063.1 histone deacetylase family protein [Roseomonas sp. GC11]
MRVLLPPGHAAHDPDPVIGSGAGARPYFETPARIAALLRAVQAAGLPVEENQAWASGQESLGVIAKVHEAGYLGFLEGGFAAWRSRPGREADLAVRPSAFAVRPLNRRPSDIVGLAGWYLGGNGAPLLEGSWGAILASARAAEAGARCLLAGDAQAYVLTRPPGHHAYADLAGGFCFLNNAAIAAETLRAGGINKVGILDIDVHHGNGTQAIFYEREDVAFASVHGDPAGLYPFFAGYADETGQGRGLGATLNLPLPPGTGSAGWVAAVERALSALRRQAVEALVVSLGFDAQEGDPSANLAVQADGFREAGRRIGQFGTPILLVQEGGYLITRLEDNLAAFLDGFLAARGIATRPQLTETPA